MTPTDAYRGAGRPEATYAIERAMDALAAKMGVDPLELRPRNYIRKEQFPYTAMTGLVYDCGDHQAAADKAARARRLRRRCAPSRRSATPADAPSSLGIGVSSATSRCAAWPRARCSPR